MTSNAPVAVGVASPVTTTPGMFASRKALTFRKRDPYPHAPQKTMWIAVIFLLMMMLLSWLEPGLEAHISKRTGIEATDACARNEQHRYLLMMGSWVLLQHRH